MRFIAFNAKFGCNRNIFLQKSVYKLLTDNELVYILLTIKMKLAIRFDACAACDEVLETGFWFCQFHQVFNRRLSELPKAFNFFAFSEGYPLPAKKDIPKLCAMKMNEAIRFNRWWWGSRT